LVMMMTVAFGKSEEEAESANVGQPHV